MNKHGLFTYLREHPGSGSTDVAKAMKVTPVTAASMMLYYYKKGDLTRVENRASNGAPCYMYSLYAPAVNQVTRVPQRNAAKPVPQQDLISQAVSRLVDEITAPIREQIESRLSAAVTLHVEQALAALPQRMAGMVKKLPTLEVPTLEKTRVAIIGLLPEQQGLIQTEFGDLFKLYFVETTKTNVGKLKAAGNCAKVFVMGSFISHGQLNVLQSAGISFTTCMGGMSTLRGEMRSYLEEVTA